MTKLALEIVDCPLCASSANRAWGEENGFTGVKCLECGLVYVSPRPTSASIDEATKLGVHQVDKGTLEVTYKPHSSVAAIYRAQISSAFAEEIKNNKPLRWLDIGAGYGEFVKELQHLLPAGSGVHGVEPMEAKRKHAEKLGIYLLESLPTEKDSFDVISILNVFSHIPDFRAFLAEIVSHLRPGGSLFIRTGNGGDLDHRRDYPDKLDFPDHLAFAGRTHLERYLAEQNMFVCWFDERRIDTVFSAAKAVVKKVIGRKTQLFIPYTVPFRDIWLRADHDSRE